MKAVLFVCLVPVCLHFARGVGVGACMESPVCVLVSVTIELNKKLFHNELAAKISFSRYRP